MAPLLPLHDSPGRSTAHSSIWSSAGSHNHKPNILSKCWDWIVAVRPGTVSQQGLRERPPLSRTVTPLTSLNLNPADKDFANFGSSASSDGYVDTIVVDEDELHDQKRRNTRESIMSTTRRNAPQPHIYTGNSVIRIVMEFFHPKFSDPKFEKQFLLDNHANSKSFAIFGSAFFVLNWILSIAFTPRPWFVWMDVIYYCVATLITLPIPFLVIYDVNIRWPWFYQIFLFCSTWFFAALQIVFIKLCDMNQGPEKHCAGLDFLSFFFYSVGLPVAALFALGQNRISAMVGHLAFFIITCVLVTVPHSEFVRPILNFGVFSLFVLTLSYAREMVERRSFALRQQLELQCEATEQAQMAERKAAQSKQDFVSYLFHEVRTPLNVAVLSVENLESSGLFDQSKMGEFVIDYKALNNSLVTMQEVLNSVLDYHRMEASRFESVSQPFCLHSTVSSVTSGLQVAAKNKNIDVTLELDPEIDYAAQRLLNMEPLQTDKLAVLAGDEARFRQIVSNLASNAVKFTRPGGRIRVTSKLLNPQSRCRRHTRAKRSSSEITQPISEKTLVAIDEKQTSSEQREHECVRFRIEIEDSGTGIAPEDLQDAKLFSPYVQSEIGRKQGGKGSGLGLALVRHIVAHSHGRLGVRSQAGNGSCFWFELCLPVVAVSDKMPPPPSPQKRQKTHSGAFSDVCRMDGAMRPLSVPQPSPAQEVSNPMDNIDKLSVMVCDDDKLTRRIIRRTLERLNCIVSEAENGQQLLDVLIGQDQHFDALFVDQSMPVLSGKEAAAQLRSHGRKDLLVGITGDALVEQTESYLEAGADKVLRKPVNQALLVEVLELAKSRRAVA